MFKNLQDLREKPLPDLSQARMAREHFRSHPINRQTPLYDEAMADAQSFGLSGENYYHSARNPPYWRRIDGAIPQLLLRASVGEKLAAVNAQLNKAGLELFVFDAWRPRAVQTYFHDVWMPGELQKRNPALTGDALIREVERYWARPSTDENSPAPHATGAAVDLTLRWCGGEVLWMGSLFDDVTEIAHRDHFERDFDFAFSHEEARANRRLLHWVMAEQGFAGHPDEWWHFSYGDQLWAALNGVAAAHYGEAVPVTAE